MQTLQKNKIDLSTVRNSIYEEIKNQIEDENSSFDNEIEVIVDGRCFYTKVSGCRLVTPAYFQGSHDCPPDPDRVSTYIDTIESITYMDDTDNEIPVNIDTEKLRKELNENLSY